jgi:hypothetical protein
MNLRKRLFGRSGIVLGCIALLAGCLSIPLGDPEKSTVDNKMVGWWEQADQPAGDHQLVSVQAYDARTYLVMYYTYAKDGANITAKGTLIYKGWLTPIGTARFLTLKLMNPTPPTTTDTEKDRYFVSRVESTEGGWTVQALSDKFVKDCATPDVLQQKVADNLKNADLYDAPNPTPFQKAAPDLVDAVMKAFNP